MSSKNIKSPKSDLSENEISCTILKADLVQLLSKIDHQNDLLKSALAENDALKAEIGLLIENAEFNQTIQVVDQPISQAVEPISAQLLDLATIKNDEQVEESTPEAESVSEIADADVEHVDVEEEDEEALSTPLAPAKKITNLPFNLKYLAEKEYESYQLSPGDTKAVLNEFNDTDFAVTESLLLHKIFEETAKKHADLPALVYKNQFLTFEELNQQANQMARYLRARGVHQGETIGIAIPHSIDLVVAMIAILKSGCTYILIDPKETNKRLKFITFNADVQAIITLSDQSKKYTALGNSKLKVINLDKEKGEMSEMEASNLDVLFSPITPIHILYSSSPIKPVGVPFYSKTVLNELNWLWNNYPYSLREIACQIASPSRIEFTTEIWAPLLKGITNIMVAEEVVLDPEKFVDFLNEVHVSRIQLPPSVLAMMMNTVPDMGDKLDQIETWFLRGEILHSELIAQFKETIPGKKIINLYNVTESGGIVASFESNIKTDSKGICLGLPIDNVKVYLLDEEGRRVNPGQAGQIAVSSFGTETGYLKNPILTKGYYAEDTLTKGLEGSRTLFLTGDYGRLTADGYLEYLGRKDDQIKYYGNKIDLNDISKVLMKQNEVNEAVISPIYNDVGQLVITSYLLVNDQTYSVQNWRKYLLKQMPEYMVPVQIYQVKSTERGSKSNLNEETMQLFAADIKEAQLERSKAPARDEIEKQLTEIWQKLLNRTDISVNDDFFEVGGNYIQTYRLKNSIHSTFDISVNSDIVYRNSTISDLANLLRESIRFKEKEAAVSNDDFVESFTQKIKVLSKEAVMDKNKVLEIQLGLPDRPKFFCVHGEDGDIAYLRYWLKHLGEQPFYSFQPSSIANGKKEDFKSIEEIATDYIKEMQKLQPRGPYFLGGYSVGGLIAYEMAQQLNRLGETISALILVDTLNPVLSHAGPTLRNRFENLAAAPAAYFNRSLFKKLAEQNFGKGLYNSEVDATQTLISPNFRKVMYEEKLNDLIRKYKIKPYTGSILLITSTESAAALSHASIDRGWKGYALSLKIHEIQGDRESLLKEPNSKKVVQALTAYVKSVSKKTKGKKVAQTA